MQFVRLAKKALDIKGNSNKEIVNVFCLRLQELMETVNIKSKVSQLDKPAIAEDKYQDSITEMTENAFQDFCNGANPRFPRLSELKELYSSAYQ